MKLSDATKHPIISTLLATLICWLFSMVIPQSRDWWAINTSTVISWLCDEGLIERWFLLLLIFCAVVMFWLGYKLGQLGRSPDESTELQKALDELRTKIKAQQDAKPSLNEKDEHVLRYLVLSNNGLSCKFIAIELKMSEARALHCLEKLEQHDYVQVMTALMQPNLYKAAAGGRTYAAKLGWLD